MFRLLFRVLYTIPSSLLIYSYLPQPPSPQVLSCQTRQSDTEAEEGAERATYVGGWVYYWVWIEEHFSPLTVML